MSKTIVITGCSSGFGYDLALKLARGGDRVYATMRAPEGKNASAAQSFRDLASTENLDLCIKCKQCIAPCPAGVEIPKLVIALIAFG